MPIMTCSESVVGAEHLGRTFISGPRPLFIVDYLTSHLPVPPYPYLFKTFLNSTP